MEPSVKVTREPLGTWFHLKDPERPTFELDPIDGDAQYWCGDAAVRDKLSTALGDGLASGVPRLILYGEYGTGKTHALCHCQWLLENDERTRGRVHCARLEWAGFGSRTRFLEVYRETMVRLGIHFISGLLREHLNKNKQSLALPQHLADTLGRDSDFEQVARRLAGTHLLLLTTTPSPDANLAWRWLTGHALNQSQRTHLNVSASLAEDANPTRLTKLLQLWGYLLEHSQERKLILLYDEAEQVSELLRGSRDALSTFTSAIRALFDRSQKNVGVILAFYATNLDESALIRPDTYSRLDRDKQVIALGTLATPERRRKFLHQVLVALVRENQPQYHPFDAPAFAYFAEHCDKLVIGLDDERRALFTRQGDPTPRTVLVALEAITRVAYNCNERQITIDLMKRNFPRLRGK